MTKRIIFFLVLLITGLVSGITLGILIGFNPERLSALAYLEQQQNTILSLNVLMPALGLIAIVLAMAVAFLHKSDKVTFWTMLLAAALLIMSGIITRFGNQPINAVVMTWKATDIPANWIELRDAWWRYHTLRTMASLFAFGLTAWSVVRSIR